MARTAVGFGPMAAAMLRFFALQRQQRFGIFPTRIGDISAAFMSELGSIAAPAAGRAFRLRLPAAPLSHPLAELAGVVLLLPLLMSAALWNGFPLIFYDTGAYVLQGFARIFVPERAPIYSFFLFAAGGKLSVWLVALVQSALTAFVIVAFARAVRPELSLWSLLAIGAALCVATGLPWYAAQVEPDIFVALVPLTLYLLMFGPSVGVVRKTLLFAVAALSIAVHSSHVALAGGLIVCAAAMRLAPARLIEEHDLPRPRLLLAGLSLMLAIASVLAANYGFTKHVFFSRTGATFLEARLMEDDLIRPILEEDCPRVHYALCPYAERLPHRADAWLWSGKASPFGKLGGFRKREAEASQLVVESIARYPLTNLIVALENTAVQLFWFQTGDGIVPQEWLLNREFKWAIPQELKAYDHAWQQEGDLWFLPINIIHVPVAFLSLAGLFLFLRQTIQARQWRQAVLPAFVALALFGNAFVCATFSGAHGRYQSRIMWLPALTLALIGWPAAEAAFQRRFRLLAAATPRLATEIESVP